MNGNEIDFDESINNLPIVPADANANQIAAANKRVQKIIDREEKYGTNKVQAFSIIYGQCTKSLQNKLKERENWKNTIYNNPIELLKAIREYAYGYQPAKYPIASVLKALRVLCSMRKHEDETLSDYQRRSNSAKDVFKSLGGRLIFENYLQNVNAFDIWDDGYKSDYKQRQVDDVHD